MSIRVSKRRPTKTDAVTRRGDRVLLTIGLGSTGVRCIELLRDVVPYLAPMTVSMDGEISQDQASRSDHLIAVPDAPVADFLETRGRVPFLASDPLIGQIRFPHNTERAAGTCRTIGILKGAGAFDQFRQKTAGALMNWLGELRTQERLIIDANIVAAAGGGFGSGLIVPVTLLFRDQVRTLFPQARCNVHVHLILANNFEGRIADPDIRTKVRANELATYLELNAMQDPTNAARLYGLLDCEAVREATFDRVIPYSVSDARGRTATLEDVLSDRVIANIIASGDAAVANQLRAVDANANAKTSASVAVAHPMISVSQAAVLAVPQQLGPCWAARETRRPLQATLAKPSPERLNGFLPTLAAGLEIAAVQNKAERLGEELLANILTPAGALNDSPAAEAHASLSATYQRYDATVRPAIAGKRQTLVSHHEANVVSKAVSGLVDALVDGGCTIHELAVLLKEGRRSIGERAEQARRQAEEAAQAVKGARDAYQADIAKLAAKPRLAGGLKESAAGQLNALIFAEFRVVRLRTLLGMLRPFESALSRAEEEARLLHGEALKALGKLNSEYKELRGLVTFQSPTLASVISPEELDGALQWIDEGICNSAAALPALDIKALIRGRHLAVTGRIEAHTKALVEVFDAYFDANLVDVTGTIQALNLNCSPREWFEENVHDLACCSPVRLSTAGGTVPQTVVAATGEDLATLREIQRSRAASKTDIIPGSNPRAIVMYRRMDNLTIESIPTFADAKRAAAKFPKPGTGRTAWETLASSGHVLAAFDQKGLVPEAWHITPRDEPHHDDGHVIPTNRVELDDYRRAAHSNGEPKEELFTNKG
jgi:hypothetical protein